MKSILPALFFLLVVNHGAYAQVTFEEHFIEVAEHSTYNVVDIDSGDLDGDGDLDIVSVSVDDGKIAYYINTNGNYGEQIIIKEGMAELADAELVDVEGDGDLDIAFLQENSRFQVLINEGLTFVQQDLVSAEASLSLEASEFQIMDLNNDGTLDIIAHRVIGPIGILLNGSVDGFDYSPVSYLAGGKSFMDYAIGQVFSNTGVDIIAAANQELYSFQIEASGEVIENLFYETPHGFGCLAIGDLNANGSDDIVYVDKIIGDYERFKIFTFKNTGGGINVFEQEVEFSCQMDHVLLQDMNNDGREDLLIHCDYKSELLWLKNINQSFSNVDSLVSGSNNVQDLIVQDIDDDEDMEIITAHGISSYIQYYDPVDNQYSSSVDLSGSHVNPEFSFMTDIDANGEQDLIVGFSASGELVQYNYRDGVVTNETQLAEGLGVLSNAKAVNLDDDEPLEIITVEWGYGNVFLLDYNSETQLWEKELIREENKSFALAVEDVLDDNNVEVVISNNSRDSLMLYTWQDGLVNQSLLAESGSFFIKVEVADMDQDGDKDILALSYDGSLQYISNDNKENFEPAEIIAASGMYSALEIVDIQGDLYPDIILNGENSASVMYNNADGTYQSENIDFPNFSLLYTIPIDINDDGYKDLIANLYYAQHLYGYLYNPETNAYDELVEIEMDQRLVTFIEVFDVDQDGDDDIITGSIDTQIMAWYENKLETATHEYYHKHNILLAPVPATDYVDVISDQAIEEVQVFNVLGQHVLSTQQSRIDVSKLESGLYYARVLTRDGMRHSLPLVVEG